ncbi:MAG TPA: arginine--tRNA ligase [Candidatus Obscuribacterales bacterium]
MIEKKLTQLVESALAQAVSNKQLGTLDVKGVSVIISRPRQPEHGDYATDVAFKLASRAKMDSAKVAEILKTHLLAAADGAVQVEIAGRGYINFRLTHSWFAQLLSQVHALGADFGRSTAGNGRKVLVEYVSANPTGDLHVGHARIAVFGSCLAGLLKFAGFEVTQEFYINDAGEQVAKLTRSAWALYLKLNGKEVEYPQDGYPEASLKGYLEAVVAEHGSEYVDEPEGAKTVGELTKALIIEKQKAVLGEARVSFDNWFSELSLHASGKVNEALAKLGDAGLTYTEDGATIFKAQSLGDTRDRFLTKKEDGTKTYLAADIAYHLDKFERGYDLVINIWGADHHGQVPGLKAAIQGLGGDAEKLEVILMQIVNLKRDGQLVRMSKRLGTVVLMSELIEEVGVDAVRYYLAESSPDNAISFDLELAKKQSRENPAYYIQYAHTRCAGILRKALAGDKVCLSADEWQHCLAAYASSPESFLPLFSSDASVAVHQKTLIARLGDFPAIVQKAAQQRAVSLIAHYAYDLACDLQKFYETSPVITDDLAVTKARLGLIAAVETVLKSALSLIGVSAPERM